MAYNAKLVNAVQRMTASVFPGVSLGDASYSDDTHLWDFSDCTLKHKFTIEIKTSKMSEEQLAALCRLSKQKNLTLQKILHGLKKVGIEFSFSSASGLDDWNYEGINISSHCMKFSCKTEIPLSLFL